MSIRFSKTKDLWNKVKKELNSLAKKDVLVGIPQDNSTRKEGFPYITNAELMFIHTNGSPVNRIPARPTLEPAVEENKDRISSMYKKAFKQVLAGGSPDDDLNKIGLYTQNKAKKKFGSDELAPNTPYTIKQKGSDRPLIDTGQLRNSVTYIIRKK